MSNVRQTEKVIGFVDILGFKNLVQAAEAGTGLPLEEVLDAARILCGKQSRAEFARDGPVVCPKAPYLRRDLEFEVTQVSDSVLVSAELSPAGVINLVGHCWEASMNLLIRGIMCRGYIKLGRIHHAGIEFLGSGPIDAIEREKAVSFLKRDADDRGTPFIEIDPEVVEFVNANPDVCVKEMFRRMTHTDGGLTALYPIKRIGVSLGPHFSVHRAHQQITIVRGLLTNLKGRVAALLDPTAPSAIRKGEHYVRMLDDQLAECQALEKFINTQATKNPSRYDTQ